MGASWDVIPAQAGIQFLLFAVREIAEAESKWISAFAEMTAKK
jgi:hypothetical protein